MITFVGGIRADMGHPLRPYVMEMDGHLTDMVAELVLAESRELVSDLVDIAVSCISDLEMEELHSEFMECRMLGTVNGRDAFALHGGVSSCWDPGHESLGCMGNQTGAKVARQDQVMSSTRTQDYDCLLYTSPSPRDS
eukprot:TRINITY_DN11764_c0_g2_i1.p2 TRINITY_DN11764_c0_g2~~TRINITY_DN11764_c0_g2_i1.p2  ORF type:complete len:138 (-),score=19.40 TRINITY_DN11764_c0_g2_i1:141-554(-)